MIRNAETRDLDAIEAIYDAIHTQEESGAVTIGWIRGVYPVRQTAEAALSRGDLFAEEVDSAVVAAAVINQTQVDCYRNAAWQYPAPDGEVMVLHTLTVHPDFAGRGYGKAFVSFYEQYALSHGCRFLRMDTNARNARARQLYASLGYREVGAVPCVFNGIPDVRLVCMEKRL